ncbi:unnamed protein product [Miscanthus lutarioriparius]|uniref:Uncharacterized protein n=1 Tax=Miscanthus lutarioriparius TaxID=422564 RepID=A0A811SKW8_9POAL|nr:unnamed protein product [Miscanthus lutarioriparius]
MPLHLLWSPLPNQLKQMPLVLKRSPLVASLSITVGTSCCSPSSVTTKTVIYLSTAVGIGSGPPPSVDAHTIHEDEGVCREVRWSLDSTLLVTTLSTTTGTTPPSVVSSLVTSHSTAAATSIRPPTSVVALSTNSFESVQGGEVASSRNRLSHSSSAPSLSLPRRSSHQQVYPLASRFSIATKISASRCMLGAY